MSLLGFLFYASKPFPASIGSIVAGANVCLESAQVYANPLPANKDFVEGSAYINLNMNIPDKNFFMAMISDMTIEHAIKIAENLSIDLQAFDLVSQLPTDVLTSGIRPFNPNNPACATLGNTIKQILGKEQLNLDCYAYFAVSPFLSNRIEQLNLDVPRGISFGGTLNLFNFVCSTHGGQGKFPCTVFSPLPS